MQVKTVFEKLT